MLTKESVVARLLEEKLITVEEAVVLLKGEDFNGIKYVQVPGTTNPWIGPGPTTPHQPYTPSPGTAPYNPMFPQCDWTVRPDSLPRYYTGTPNLNGGYGTINCTNPTFDLNKLNKNYTEK